jgi:putative oligomerization/nucleic acid binding protein
MRSLLGFITIGFIIWILIELAREKKEHLAATKAAYEQNLARLKEDPTNPELKQRTLALGRTYSNLTRNRKGVALYDEVALSNDITSACAAVSVPPSSAVTASPEERLAKLADLRNQGLVDEEEYQAQRRRVLNEL